MLSSEVSDMPAGEDPSRGLQLVRDLRSFFGNSGHQPLPFGRPSDWHCPACNVSGRGIRPAACWCCGTEAVDYRVPPPTTGAHRFHEPNAQEGV